MRHYILVEVRESGRNPYNSDLSIIRTAIHKICQEKDINAADCVIRQDQQFMPFYISGTGHREKVPYGEARELFNKAMGHFWRTRQEQNLPWDNNCKGNKNDYTT